MRVRSILAIALALSGTLAAVAAPQTGKVARDGIAVEYAIEHGPLDKSRQPFHEGDPAVVRFRISDAATGHPLVGAQPAAWLYRTNASTGEKDCQDLIKRLLAGDTFLRADVDLNTFYVLALNEDATITVVDPLFSYGNTRLLAMVNLQSRGDDWALTSDRKTLFVSMPDVNRVAVVDTLSWKVIRNIDVTPQPRRVALQPDEAYLWVACNSGVAAISTAQLNIAASIRTADGDHDVAVSDNSRYVFVTNSGTGTVSVIDVRSLSKKADVATGSRPVSIAWSALAGAAYVVNGGDGSVAVVDPQRAEPLAHVTSNAGSARISFEPKARYAFVVNPDRNEVLILDTAVNRIVQRATVGPEPDRVAFSEKLAYVRHRKSEIVEMIPLDMLGAADGTVSVVEFPAGQRPLGETAHLSSADTIVEAPGEAAVLVANPGDKTIYYYHEGMAAPSGSFSNYSQEPRAVMVVDRSLKQRTPGAYETAAQLTKAGQYTLAFFLDTPRFVQCFDGLVVEPHEITAAPASKARIEVSADRSHVRVGETIHLRFELKYADGKPAGHTPVDLRALFYLPPGVWQSRSWAEATGASRYKLDFAPTRGGTYQVFIECPALGITFSRTPDLVLEADEGKL